MRGPTWLAATMSVALVTSAFAAAPFGDIEVTLEMIMADPDWLGRSPESPYWADDGESFFYERKVEGSEERQLFEGVLDGTPVRRVEDADRGTSDVAGGAYDRARARKVYSRRGDVYVKDLASGEIRQLTRTAAAELGPGFTADGAGVYFYRDGTVFVRDLASGLERQVADLRVEDDAEAEDEELSFLEEQQRRLFDVVRERSEDEDEAEAREKAEQRADPTRSPLPVWLGADRELIDVSYSPAGRWMVITTVAAERDRGVRTPMPLWVTESGDVETAEVRPKVGLAGDSAETVALVDLESGEAHPLDPAVLPGILEDPLAGLREAARAAKEAARAEARAAGEAGEESPNGDEQPEEAEPEEPAPRPFQVERIEWTADGGQVALQIHSLDNKDRWTASVDFEARAFRPLHHLHDPAWINYRHNDLAWLDDGETLLFLSEESGYSNLYAVGATRGEPRLVAGGDFVVSDFEVMPDGAAVIYLANAGHPGIFEIYRVGIAGGVPEQLTDLGGLNEAILSPDGSRLLVTHSSALRPPELYLLEAVPGAPAVRVTDTISEDFLAIDWTAPEFIEVPSSHVERPIHSRLYRPVDDTGGALRPAVVFVHGAGYLQNAHQGWSGYFREFMFHTLLARLGYVVLDMDYRASAGYGRDWRTAIYRQMGTPELDDLRDGVDWLVTNAGVDRSRIGVYGGSYGGFMTLFALFRDPDLFAAGAALRPVTDWAHYNHPYTSNILNTPEIDPEAYAVSSPIEFADGLARPLLLCAPMLDDNVLFQDTVRLVQRLIELEKEDFETAVYPVEPHGFRQPSSWLDEYRRILKLFERHVRPVGPGASGAPAQSSPR